MSDERLCVCSDSCTSGIVGGPGCTSEPAHRSLAEAAFGPVTLSPSECAAFEIWLQRCTSEPTPKAPDDQAIFRAMVRHGTDYESPGPIAEFDLDVVIESVEVVPAPTGGYRPPYLAARAQSSRRLTERDVDFLFPGQRPALRIVRAEPGCCGDSGDCNERCDP